jgi:hypothetical protein
MIFSAIAIAAASITLVAATLDQLGILVPICAVSFPSSKWPPEE